MWRTGVMRLGDDDGAVVGSGAAGGGEGDGEGGGLGGLGGMHGVDDQIILQSNLPRNILIFVHDPLPPLCRGAIDSRTRSRNRSRRLPTQHAVLS